MMRRAIQFLTDESSFPYRWANRHVSDASAECAANWREQASAAAIRCILTVAMHPQSGGGGGRFWRGNLNRLLARAFRHVDAPDGLADQLADELRDRPDMAHLSAWLMQSINIRFANTEIFIHPSNKLMLIGVTKVASRSIEQAMDCGDGDASPRLHFRSIDDAFRRLPSAESYFTVTFVRHPVDRALSAFRFLKSEAIEGNAAELRKSIEYRNGVPNHLHDFGAFCRWLDQPLSAPKWADRHWAPQARQVRLPGGRLPDFVGRFETLDADWSRLQARFPHLPALPRMNASRSPSAGGRARGTAHPAKVLRRGFRGIRIRIAARQGKSACAARHCRARQL